MAAALEVKVNEMSKKPVERALISGTQASTSSTETTYAPELGYIELLPKYSEKDDPSANWRNQEGFREKFLRKTRDNPFVPIGLGVTIAALSYGLWQMKTGDKVMSQRMMRVRVAAQAFTVVALLGGVMYEGYKKNN